MTFPELLGFEPGPAICYSGYRQGQSPDTGVYPSLDQIGEDLRLLARHFRFLRLYDCTTHAERVLEVIARERLGMRVLLGAWPAAEVDNPGCPWGGGIHGPERLARNRDANARELERLVALSRKHPATVAAVAVGNEASVGWTDHLVPPARVAAHVRAVKAEVEQPVTVCDNHVPWRGELDEVAGEVDFVSVHSYPVWEQQGLDEALRVTDENWRGVAGRLAGKPVVITEAGWPTRADGKAIDPANASEELQAAYLAQLERWRLENGVTVFVFEAFDEPWKGSADPAEPEKHWGLYGVDRQPKLAALSIAPGPARGATP